MIRKLTFFISASLLLLGSVAEAKGRTGLGIIFHEPTGVSLKHWINRKTAIDGAFAWAFDDEDAAQLHFDLLFHHTALSSSNGARLPLYYGLGAKIVFEDETRLGIRIPLGCYIILSTIPLDIFAEVVPLLYIAPDSEFSFTWAFGIRYFIQ